MRVFFAVQIPATPPIRAVVAELDRLGGLFKVVDAAQLHVTLRFVGEASAGELDALHASLDRAAAGVSWFNLRLCGLGTFPPGRSDGKRMPRVIYAGTLDAQPLDTMAARLAQPGNRPFAAHVTLARHRPNRRPSRTQRDRLAALFEQYGDADFGTVPVRELCLVESVLTPTGPRHASLRRAVLGP